jgi:tryptophan 2-monooxygenase
MRTHIVSSNKVAVRISNFWSGNSGAIRCLQTDGTAHQIYTLNYGTGANGCCFMTYVWDDDAVKQQSITGGIPSNPADNETLCKFLYNSVKSIDSGVANWVQQYLQPVDGDWKNNVIFEEWQSQPYFGGAFKLSEPGQDQYVSDMFWDFQKANAVGVAPDTGVYIAGDCISWTSGWVEGALTTGLNAAAAVITSLGGKVTANRNNSQSPMTISSRYNYLA